MDENRIRFAAWTAIASVLAGCTAARPAEEYRAVPLAPAFDPLVQEKNFTPWRPPRQMAAFIHPHEDLEQGIMIGGHWILVLLGEGSWYFEDLPDREPIPDAEATPEDVRSAVGALQVPRDAVIPYRLKEGLKP